MKKLLAIMALPFLFTTNALANESEVNKTKTSLPEATAKETKSDKADELITNRRFRAQTGSLSALSINSSFSYSGGSIKDPLSADRPNIVGAADTALISGISGSINGNYRMTKVDRIGVGAGVQMLAPFHSEIETNNQRTQAEFDENQGKLDVSNPYVSYTRLAKIYGVQTVVSAGLTKYTTGNFTDAGYNYNTSFSLNTMYDFGGSSFSVGVLGVFDRNLFDNDDPALAGFQAETVYGFLPQAEYVINDTFNLRTIVRSHWYQKTRAAGAEFVKRDVTQSVGLGISVSRDVFLYPNVQFAWDNFTAENTNVGLSANINMF